jgi:hypothetical protein
MFSKSKALALMALASSIASAEPMVSAFHSTSRSKRQKDSVSPSVQNEIFLRAEQKRRRREAHRLNKRNSK